LVPPAHFPLPWIFTPLPYGAADFLLLDVDKSSSFKSLLDKRTDIKGHADHVTGLVQPVTPLLVRVVMAKVNIRRIKPQARLCAVYPTARLECPIYRKELSIQSFKTEEGNSGGRRTQLETLPIKLIPVGYRTQELSNMDKVIFLDVEPFTIKVIYFESDIRRHPRRLYWGEIYALHCSFGVFVATVTTRCEPRC
jgi:hypothetical protein